jgi:DNA-binding CsgD family transcriptional regulator
VRAELGHTSAELARLLPGFGEAPAAAAPDHDTERHRLHSAVTELLALAGRRSPLLLALEDSHWADTSTLLLLRHLARASADAPVLVLATFRDTEAEIPVELAEALAELRRSEHAVRIGLVGLSEEEVAEFVAAAAGAPGADVRGLARGIRDLTGGNPFLLSELWRTLVETGAVELAGGAVRLTRPLDEVVAPEGVREVVTLRLARLQPETRELLELAAVAGPEFELALLRRAAPRPLERLDVLEPAESAGLIEPVPSRRLRHRFTHELVRRALYDRLGSIRRAELHLRVAEALEGPGRPRSARALSELAYHFTAAAALGRRERAVEYNLAAAAAATAGLAADEAVARLRTALELGVDDERREASVRLDLATACHRAGRTLDALGAYHAAAETARRLRDGELAAAAAIGFENACRRALLRDGRAVELLDDASSLIGAADSALRVGVLAALARALAFNGDPARGAVVCAGAIAMARRIDDRRGLAAALHVSYWARGSASLADLLELLTESRDVAAEVGDVENETEAMMTRLTVLEALGELDAARRQLAVAADRARRLRQPFVLHGVEQHVSALALLEGRLDDAEAAAERAREWGTMLTGPDPSGAYGIQMFGIRREQGRLAELAPAARVLGGDGGAWRPALAALLAELGMRDEVERELARIRRDGLEPLRQSLWLASLTYLADACAAVGDRAVAALVYPELAPLAGTCVTIGYSVACYGAADRYLGMLAAVLGDRARAETHLLAALELNRRMGARTWLAHTCHAYARLLRAGGEPERAAPFLDEATTIAEQVGLESLLRRLRVEGGGPAPLPHGLSERERDVLLLVARGLSNREIGAALAISEHTTAKHVRSILRKTGCANRTDAASFAHRRGLVGA